MGLESADDPAESDCIRCRVMPRPRPHGGGGSRVSKSQPSWGHLADHHGIAAGHDDHGPRAGLARLGPETPAAT
jgi:hypothetical protein